MKHKEIQGILVGVDETQEWMLPWWYYHCQKLNTLPITFANFGMSKKALAWCQQKGKILSLPEEITVTPKEKISKKRQKDWEKIYPPQMWKYRHQWFKKPIACCCSPYEKTIWMDVDCQIMCTLDPLFSLCDTPAGISLSLDIFEYKTSFPKKIYNSGVIVFRKNSPIIKKWKKVSESKNHLFAGDQDALTHALQRETLHELPILYNWLASYNKPQENVPIHIYHYAGHPAKKIIQKQIFFLQTIYQDFFYDTAALLENTF